MRNTIALVAAACCLFFSSCQRPVAYFQPTAHPAAARLPIENVNQRENAPTDMDEVPGPAIASIRATESDQLAGEAIASSRALVSRTGRPHQTTASRMREHIQHVNILLAGSDAPPADQQPGPKPRKKLKLGNQIRQSLGMKLRPELNWWQRISWKLKASVFVILLAVVFALLHITVLAIIFGIIGALLLMSGLKKSFKVRRPWF